MAPLTFYVNGKKVVDASPDPEWTLLYYLRRKLKLCGTKMGCAEGGCGTCTVMVSKFDRKKCRPIHLAVNACLAPVCSMHGLAVTTVEGIGSTKTRLHPVQERIAKAHGTQCGFCTPGIVMSMYALLRNSPKPSFDDLEVAFQGNLCRCTGYRPILEGYKTFTEEWETNRIATQNGVPTNGCAMGDNCCKNKKADDSPSDTFEASTFMPYDPTQEPIFPAELALNRIYDEENLTFRGKSVTWYRPTSLKELLKIKSQHNDAKIVTGNTEVGIEVKFKKMTYPVLVSPNQVEELNRIDITDTGVTIGASVTLTDMESELNSLIDTMPANKTRIFKSIVEMLHWFAGKQIRNVSAVGGNIMTGSPISDLNPIFMAAGAKLLLINENGKRIVKMDSGFFTGYRKNVVRPNEILLSISIPFTDDNHHFKALKQARKREDDIAIVNIAVSVLLDDAAKIRDIAIAYGGMADRTILVKKSCQALIGESWNDGMLHKANKWLLDELNLDPSAPGGMIRYRHALALSLFFKIYTDITSELSPSAFPDISAFSKFEPQPLKSSQYFAIPSDRQSSLDPIGRPLVHASALKHTTGEAVYCDDIPPIEGELYLAFLLSSRAHARLVSIDATEALTMEGVVAFFSAKDIDPKRNRRGVLVPDEEIFVSETVTSQGQILGAVVAVDSLSAQKALPLIKVVYEDLSPIILSTRDAVEKRSYFPDYPVTIIRGSVEEAFASTHHVVEDEFSVGAQEHFYLETQAARAVPKGEDGEMEIFCSAQHPSEINKSVAEMLGRPINRIVTKVKRLGGGFGGKETKSILIALPVAFAADRLQKPVRCMLDRDEDMQITAGRHPFIFKYKLAVQNDGRITGAHIIVYCNAGYSLDVSPAMLERAMHHCINAYNIPNLKIEGYLLKTNLPSNTAFRGSGAPQGMLLAENYIRNVARKLKMDYLDVIKKNLLEEGLFTHYNMELSHCTLNRCFEECIEKSNYFERKEQVEDFNRKNKWKKRGISIVPTMYGVSFTIKCLNQAGALIHVYTDGSVLLTHGGVEIGQGLHTKMLQIASRALNVDVSKIFVSETSTDKVPNTSPTAASVSSDLNGMAVLDACDTIMRRLKPIVEKNPEGRWEDWVRQAYSDCISLSATGHYATEVVGYDLPTNSGRPYHYFTYGVACSEVELDCMTGDHYPRRTDIVMDVGDSLNPAIDVGQIEGAFVQGYGLYTLEEKVFSPEGALHTRGTATYKVPGFTDIPREFNVSLLKGAPNPRAVYSSKAVGEPPLFLAASIFFAVREAITFYRKENGYDEQFRLDSPATCEKIRMACQDSIVSRIEEIDRDVAQSWDIVI